MTENNYGTQNGTAVEHYGESEIVFALHIEYVTQYLQMSATADGKKFGQSLKDAEQYGVYQ